MARLYAMHCLLPRPSSVQACGLESAPIHSDMGLQALRAATAAADDIEPGTHGDVAAALPDPGLLTVAQLQVH